MSDVMMANNAAVPERNGAFNSINPIRPNRSVFDLSHEKKLSADFGQLIPSMCLEMVPGDKFDIANHIVVRMQPMIAPVLHEINATIHYFFVPNRLVWRQIDTSGNDWETFITGGVNGTSAPTLPKWNVAAANCTEGSLWDYFGLPVVTLTTNFTTTFPDAAPPMDLPKRAYNLIFNEYFRDETLTTALDINVAETVQLRSWSKDYFTSALPWLQRGTAPAFPISGQTSAVWTSATFPNAVQATGLTTSTTASTPVIGPGIVNANAAANILGAFNANTVSGANLTTISINDFRLQVVIQRLLERNARGGIRYTEFLQNVFDTSPRDERLQRPEYIGGVRSPITVSEVLQTSNVTSGPTPGGTMFGHGLTAASQYAGSYTAQEFGYMIGILSVMPKASYQQGIDKMWVRPTRYDWPYPEFAGLGEQGVLNQELYLAADSVNQTVFGYQGRYNELRYVRNTVHGILRTTLNYWHLGRIFSSRPALNTAFVQLSSSELTSLKRIFAVTSQPGLIVVVGNAVKAYRPFPALAEPGIRVI